MSLPTNAQARKIVPIASGFLDYFPDAVAAVAHLSWVGNNQHNPGKPLFWDRSKSTDEADALMRHFLERGTVDTDGIRHSAKVAWRALALLQKEIEAERVTTTAEQSEAKLDVPGARDPELIAAYVKYLNTPGAELPARQLAEQFTDYLLRCFGRDEE